MKNKLLFSALLLCFSLLFSACGDTVTETTAITAETVETTIHTTEKTVVTTIATTEAVETTVATTEKVAETTVATTEAAETTVATTVSEVTEEPEKVELPILLYHDFNNNVSENTADMIAKPETFEAHIKALSEAGYNTVTFDRVVDFVENGTPLPEKPICITIDDGYTSTYEVAFPILKKYNMNATVFVIGVAMGWQHYKQTNYPYIPKFDWEEAIIMDKDGTVDIQCHTYDMHQWAPHEEFPELARPNVMPLKGETDEEYTALFTADCKSFIDVYRENIGENPIVMSYPNGKYTDISEKISHELGFKVSLTTRHHSNTIVQGVPESLYLLGRYIVKDTFTAEDLLNMLEK